MPPSHRLRFFRAFEQKCLFFQLLSTIKVKLVDKMKQGKLFVILHVKHKKLPIVAFFFRDF